MISPTLESAPRNEGSSFNNRWQQHAASTAPPQQLRICVMPAAGLAACHRLTSWQGLQQIGWKGLLPLIGWLSLLTSFNPYVLGQDAS